MIWDLQQKYCQRTLRAVWGGVVTPTAFSCSFMAKIKGENVSFNTSLVCSSEMTMRKLLRQLWEHSRPYLTPISDQSGELSAQVLKFSYWMKTFPLVYKKLHQPLKVVGFVFRFLFRFVFTLWLVQVICGLGMIANIWILAITNLTL